MIQTIKSSRKQAGINEIRIPGERARQAYIDAETSGMVGVEEVVLKELGYI